MEETNISEEVVNQTNTTNQETKNSQSNNNFDIAKAFQEMQKQNQEMQKQIVEVQKQILEKNQSIPQNKSVNITEQIINAKKLEIEKSEKEKLLNDLTYELDTVEREIKDKLTGLEKVDQDLIKEDLETLRRYLANDKEKLIIESKKKSLIIDVLADRTITLDQKTEQIKNIELINSRENLGVHLRSLLAMKNRNMETLTKSNNYSHPEHYNEDNWHMKLKPGQKPGQEGMSLSFSSMGLTWDELLPRIKSDKVYKIKR